MANNKIQVKRTTVSGRQPNTTGSYATNSQYIAAGEFALNMADGILFTSNGSSVIPVGANLADQHITNTLTFDNDKRIYFKTLNASACTYFVNQNDDNFVLYTTNTSYQARPVFSIYANSTTAPLSFLVPLQINGWVNLNSVAVYSNGSSGSAGQYLTSNGSATYWSSPGVSSVNTAAQWTWTNTHTFQANVAFTGNNISLVTNTGSIFFGGSSDSNWRIGRSTGATTKFYYTNNSLDIIAADSNLEGVVIGKPGGNTYLETGYAGTFTKNPIYVGNSSVNVSINSTSFSGTSLTANNASYLGGNSASDLRTYSDTNAATAYTNSVSYTDGKILTANSAITGNAATAYTNAVSYVDGKSYVNTSQLSSNLSNYQTTAGLAANVAILAANSATYLGNSSGTIANVASWITSNASAAYTNAASYTDGKILTANAAITGNAATAYTNAVSYTDGKILTANSAITGNAATAYTNAVSYTDGKIATANAAITGNAATAYTNATIFASNASNINTGTLAEARLPYRMNQNVNSANDVTFASLTLTGNLTVSGNVTVVGSNNLSIVDNFIYLNSNNTTQNIDVGIAANYNSAGYAHTGIFRDASDGIWKVFDNYTPEPDANVNIDTSNTSFHLADFQANVVYIGNTSVYSTVNTTNFTGTANNTLYVGSVTSDNVVSNSQLSANVSTLQGQITSNASAAYSNSVSYTDGKILTANAAITGNAATAYTNAVSYVDGKSYVNTSQLSSNLSSYVTTTNLTNNLANYQTTAGLSSNVATLTANNANNLGGTAAASYALLASPTFTGTVSATNVTVSANLTVAASGDLIITSGAGISANGGFGSAGQVLASNGSSVYWAPVSSGGLTVNVVSTNTTAIKGNHYVATANLTLTLPASPTVGDIVGFQNSSKYKRCTVARNGSNIMSLAQDMRYNFKFGSIQLIYADTTTGWVFL